MLRSPSTVVFLGWISVGLGTLVYAAVAVLAAEYDRMLIFTEPLKDKALPGHVIRTERVADEGGCRVKCYLEPNCVSINVGPVDDGQQMCELNNVTDESPSHSALEERHGYIYNGVENFCHGNLCPENNFLCQVGFTNKGFRCVCKEGYSGESCNEECHKALGMESGAIADTEITASSQHDGNHAESQGRLNFKETRTKSGSWAAGRNNNNQWLQVDMGSQQTRVTRVATQGRNYNDQWSASHSQWVTKYKLQYSSDDGVNFEYYREQGQTVAKEFTGNTDRDSIVIHDLKQPIRARYIRFRPTAWHGHISMRVELYGCKECKEALGMENGAITDAQISASSVFNHTHVASQGRLNYQAIPGHHGSWSAGTNDANQWLQVDLMSPHVTVTRIATQGRNGGRHHQWVETYKLQYGNTATTFRYYREPGKTQDKTFHGNDDKDSIVHHNLNPPINARFVRFQPTAWHHHISMRVELYGCYEQTKTAIICEGSQQQIGCNAGGKIQVLFANFGRLDKYTCSHNRPAQQLRQTDCRAQTSLQRVQEKCHGKISCELNPTNTFFNGDPCGGIYKYLLVKYLCEI